MIQDNLEMLFSHQILYFTSPSITVSIFFQPSSYRHSKQSLFLTNLFYHPSYLKMPKMVIELIYF